MAGQNTPVQELELLGPVHYQDGIAYVPSPSWSRVPGCGVANLAYVPDYLLTAGNWYAGNAVKVPDNVFNVTKKPAGIVGNYQVLQGVGGLVAGQIAYQQLLEVQQSLGNTTSE